MIDIQERMRLHDMHFPASYEVRPGLHMGSPRDAQHVEWMTKTLREHGCVNLLDVGCFDSWLNFNLISRGFDCSGVELMRDLVDAGIRYAIAHNICYTVYQSWLPDLEIKRNYDAISALEVLEHIEYDSVPGVLSMLEQYAEKIICVSLPYETDTKNPQHMWSADENAVEKLFKDKKDCKCSRIGYPNTGIPDNWLLYYQVK